MRHKGLEILNVTSSDNNNSPAVLPELVAHCAARFGDTRALFAPHSKPITEISYREMAAEIASVGAGLLKIGVVPGDHLALFSDNRPRWLLADLAITGIGAVDVPRGSDTSTPEFEFILNHSSCVGAFIQDKRLYDRLASTGVMKALKFVILMDDSEPAPLNDDLQIYTYAAVKEKGSDDPAAYQKASQNVTPGHLATIVYTSGTTGSPKGVMLTHQNLMTQPRHVNLGLTPQEGEILLSILPAWHAYERAVEYYGLSHGVTIAYSDKKYIKEDLIKLSPHLLPCVPRIWEMIYKGVQTKSASAPPRQQQVFRKFMQIGQSYINARRIATGNYPSRIKAGLAERAAARSKMLALYPLYRLGDRLVYSKIRQVTGGRMRAAISGGGSLATYLDDFFEIVDVCIMNGYGLTETSPVISVRRSNHNVRGSVGLPMEQTEISLRKEDGSPVGEGETGEIWARGAQVMQGYYKNPETTAAVLTEDGWFKTGDLGWFSVTGDLVIAGRAKDTIVLSSGENVEPDPIEDACRKSPLVQQIVLVGQDEKSLGALVVPDYGKLAEALGMPSEAQPVEVIQHPDAVRTVRQAIADVMTEEGRFKASESIGRVHLLEEPFSDANGLLTNTFKIKRKAVLEKFKSEISSLFV